MNKRQSSEVTLVAMSCRVDSNRVQETERKLGVRFPLMFRGMMMRDNGGSFDAAGETWWLHPILDTGDGTTATKNNSFVNARSTHRSWG